MTEEMKERIIVEALKTEEGVALLREPIAIGIALWWAGKRTREDVAEFYAKRKHAR